MLKTRLFNSVKQLIPKISSTEMIALKSGNTSIDRDILLGKFNFPKKKIYYINSLKTNLKDFLENFILRKMLIPKILEYILIITIIDGLIILQKTDFLVF